MLAKAESSILFNALSTILIDITEGHFFKEVHHDAAFLFIRNVTHLTELKSWLTYKNFQVQ